VSATARGVSRRQTGASNDRDTEGRVETGGDQTGQVGDVERRDQGYSARTTDQTRRRMQAHRPQISAHGKASVSRSYLSPKWLS